MKWILLIFLLPVTKCPTPQKKTRRTISLLLSQSWKTGNEARVLTSEGLFLADGSTVVVAKRRTKEDGMEATGGEDKVLREKVIFTYGTRGTTSHYS